MTAEGYPETDAEIQAVAQSEAFQQHSREYQEAFWRRDAARQGEILAEVRQRYGDRLAEGLADWYSEE
jgi:hypothetical protein